jgi:hypothetical protein
VARVHVVDPHLGEEVLVAVVVEDEPGTQVLAGPATGVRGNDCGDTGPIRAPYLLFNFVTTFSVDDSGALNVTNLNFLTAGPCFPVTGLGETVGGTFDVTSAESDPTATANVTFTVKGNGNLLTLTGTATGVTNTVAQTTTWNNVTGSWTLTGSSSCMLGLTTPGGTFTMCPNSTTCTTT